MRVCGRCNHDNADHLNYCFNCGRRLGDRRPPASTSGAQVATSAASIAATKTKTAATAHAATLAFPGYQVTPAGHDAGSSGGMAGARSVPRESWDALTYVFRHVRERLDAEGRKRRLVEERRGAERLLEGALFDLGQLVLAAPASAPPLADLVDAVGQARERKDAAACDLASAERLQHVSDLRLGIEQSTAETEWQACVAGGADVDRLLREAERQRREVDEELRALPRPDVDAPAPTDGLDRGQLERKRTLADEHHRSLRERAAALRAATVAGRAKFDHATTARRQAAAGVAASLSAHARDHAEALNSIHELTIKIGRAATDARLPSPALASGYGQVTRLDATIAERAHEIARLQSTVAGYDARKLAIGLTLLVAIVLGASSGIWALLR